MKNILYLIINANKNLEIKEKLDFFKKNKLI